MVLKVVTAPTPVIRDDLDPVSFFNCSAGPIPETISDCGRTEGAAGCDDLAPRGEPLLNDVISRSVRDSAAMLDATQGPGLASAFGSRRHSAYLEEVSHEGRIDRSVLPSRDASVSRAG